jgi:hypothetical protein
VNTKRLAKEWLWLVLALAIMVATAIGTEALGTQRYPMSGLDFIGGIAFYYGLFAGVRLTIWAVRRLRKPD